MEIRVSHNGQPENITEQSAPGELLDWALKRFSGWRIATTTAFGMEGCALIDMIAARTDRFLVIYLDTHFFFPETLDLKDRMVLRYPNVQFVNRGTTLTPDEQARKYGPKLWESDPDLCCKLRKVEPMVEAMKDVDVWFSALRRSQSETRRAIGVVEWDWKYQLIKVNPLANWERADVWQYIQEHNVPYNALHEKGYPTVGCTHCTVAVPGSKPDDYTRAGRWPGQEKIACGIHGGGI